MLFIAFRFPRPARALFVLLFLAAGTFNIYTAITNPQAYLAYADLAVLKIYRDFINGIFAEYVTLIVIAIAICQLFIAGLLTSSGILQRAGVAGGVVFLLAISPLGVGSALPCTLLLSAALIAMQRTR